MGKALKLGSLLPLLCVLCSGQMMQQIIPTLTGGPVTASVSLGTNLSDSCSGATGTSTCVLPAFTVANSGDAIYILAEFCNDSGCGTPASGPATVTDTCGNTYTYVTAASSLLAAWNIEVFVVANATAGSCVITAVLAGSGVWYYGGILVAEAIGANHTSPVDSAVSNHVVSSGSSLSITSAGNVSAAGELILGTFAGTGSVTGSTCTYTSFLMFYSLPGSGASVTCTATQTGSGGYWGSMVAIKP